MFGISLRGPPHGPVLSSGAYFHSTLWCSSKKFSILRSLLTCLRLARCPIVALKYLHYVHIFVHSTCEWLMTSTFHNTTEITVIKLWKSSLLANYNVEVSKTRSWFYVNILHNYRSQYRCHHGVLIVKIHIQYMYMEALAPHQIYKVVLPVYDHKVSWHLLATGGRLMATLILLYQVKFLCCMVVARLMIPFLYFIILSTATAPDTH